MTYAEQRAALIQYLRHKVEIADWHGVSDAANDLRVLEAENRAVANRAEVTGPDGDAIELGWFGTMPP